MKPLLSEFYHTDRKRRTDKKREKRARDKQDRQDKRNEREKLAAAAAAAAGPKTRKPAKPRTRISQAQSDVLEDYLRKNGNPDREQRAQLAEKLGLELEYVGNWYVRVLSSRVCEVVVDC